MKVFVVICSLILSMVSSNQAYSHSISTLRIEQVVQQKLQEKKTLVDVQEDIVDSVLEFVPNRDTVAEFIFGRENVKKYLASPEKWPTSTTPIRPISGEYIEQLAEPDGVEIAVFFFNSHYGLGKKLPVMIFDSAFDGKGIVTIEDLIVGLEYETNRMPQIMGGIAYKDYLLSREEFLQLDLQVKKSALECLAMDYVFARIFAGDRRVSDEFFEELQYNFLKYIKILHAVADGHYWYTHPTGMPVSTSGPRETRLAQTQLNQLQFTIGITFSDGIEKEVIVEKK